MQYRLPKNISRLEEQMTKVMTAGLRVKPVLSGHSYRRQKKVFKTDNHLMQVKSIAKCSKGSILQHFKPSLSYHLSLGSTVAQW